MSHIINFFDRFGLLAMFLCILLEYGCFPVSSEIVLPLSGCMASMQKIPFIPMVLLSILAGLIGTSFCFFIGRIGGTRALARNFESLPKTKKPLRASFQTFEKYGIWAVGIGRVIPICPYIYCLCCRRFQPVLSQICDCIYGWNLHMEYLTYRFWLSAKR